MALPRVSAASFRRFALASLWALSVIVVVGVTVRLTGSGLGCPDWPTCTEQRVVAPLEYHAMIEFVNRAFSGVVGVVVAATAVASLLRVPRRRDLVWLSAGLVAGVVVQILIGRLTIEAELAPQVVMSHFLVAIVLLANAVVLWHVASPARAPTPGPPPGRGPDPSRDRPAVAPPAARSPLVPLAWLVVAVTAVVIVLGTVVTAAGPHGGDERARRLDVFLPDAARAHGVSVMVLLVLTLFTLWRVWREGAAPAVRRRGEVLLAVLVAQAVVGYVQYFAGVPVLLVLVHVAGAVAVWVAVLWFALGVGKGAAEPRVAPASPPRRTAERIAM